MHHLVRMMGIIITLTLLLAVFVRPTHAGGTISVISVSSEQPEETGLICLALVGGTAILAGGVLMGKLRRMLS